MSLLRPMKGPGFTLVPNPDLEREVLRGSDLKARLEEDTKAALGNYQQGLLDGAYDTGDLYDSTFSEVGLTKEGFRGRVGATDWKAALVEFGTSRTDPDGSLRRSVEPLGYKVVDDRE